MSGGGAERVVSYLLRYFISYGYEIHLILMNENKSYQIPKEIKVHYLEYSKANEPGYFKLLKIPLLSYKYGKLTNSLGLTHSFSLLTRPNYINIISGFFFRRTSKTVISERSFPSLQYGYKNLQSFINRVMIKWLYKKADVIICNTYENKADLVNYFSVPSEIIEVIYNPIDIQKIDQIEPIHDFYDPSYFNLITIGRLDKGKNHELLIQSIKDFKNVRLYIFGDGYLRNYLKQLIKHLKCEDRIFMMGFDANPYPYLKAADLFIFGSNHEGFPNVLLEALACGLPILSTNCQSGPAEILELEHPKENDLMITNYGILVPIKNKVLFKKGLQKSMEDTQFLSNCRNKVKIRAQEFNKDLILKQFSAVILK